MKERFFNFYLNHILNVVDSVDLIGRYFNFSFNLNVKVVELVGIKSCFVSVGLIKVVGMRGARIAIEYVCAIENVPAQRFLSDGSATHGSDKECRADTCEFAHVGGCRRKEKSVNPLV